MITSELSGFFEERLGEIADYLDLLTEVEAAAQSGPPRIEGTSFLISPSQQRVLYSSVYLQMYNLVEATVSRCVDAVAIAANNGSWRPDDLNEDMRREWVRSSARTHADLTPEKRLATAVTMCDHLIGNLPMTAFCIEVGGGGNWDDEAIERMSARLGCKFQIKPSTRTAVRRSMRNDVGALKLVKNLRNGLAHGSISFTECADGVTVSELRNVMDAVAQYLREAITCFSAYIDLFDFLLPERRPTTGT